MTDLDWLGEIAMYIYTVVGMGLIVILTIAALWPHLMDGPYAFLGPLLARVAAPGIGFIATVAAAVLGGVMVVIYRSFSEF